MVVNSELHGPRNGEGFDAHDAEPLSDLETAKHELAIAIHNLEVLLRNEKLRTHPKLQEAINFLRTARMYVQPEGEGGTSSLEVLEQTRKNIVNLDRKLADSL